jgi:hypothetical protein
VCRRQVTAASFFSLSPDFNPRCYRSAGKVRRRIRRRARARPFTNARTATRSLDLPLAIGDPHVCPSGPIFVYRSIPASVIAATAAGFFVPWCRSRRCTSELRDRRQASQCLTTRVLCWRMTFRSVREITGRRTGRPPRARHSAGFSLVFWERLEGWRGFLIGGSPR